jgi:hypothetical protein
MGKRRKNDQNHNFEGSELPNDQCPCVQKQFFIKTGLIYCKKPNPNAFYAFSRPWRKVLTFPEFRNDPKAQYEFRHLHPNEDTLLSGPHHEFIEVKGKPNLEP